MSDRDRQILRVSAIRDQAHASLWEREEHLQRIAEHGPEPADHNLVRMVFHAMLGDMYAQRGVLKADSEPPESAR